MAESKTDEILEEISSKLEALNNTLKNSLEVLTKELSGIRKEISNL